MNTKIDRREFLRLATLLFLSKTLPQFKEIGNQNPVGSESEQNVLIIVFDALSANDISFYGYPRNTMPNLSRLLDRANVYHNHYTGGNFTTPGTASLLTGTLPWTHRAFQLNESVIKPFENKNVFNAFGRKNYHRFFYTHNPTAEKVILPFQNDIDNFIPRLQLFLTKDWIFNVLKNDSDIAALSRNLIIKKENEVGINNSLFLPELFTEIIRRTKKGASVLNDYSFLFPQGLTQVSGDYYILDDSVDFLIDYLRQSPQPFLGYFHFLPPHTPYTPRREFIDLFNIHDFTSPEKQEHIFSQQKAAAAIRSQHLFYNRHIAYVDAEFARIFNHLENSGQLENTWLIFTSDHGEMFERGIIGHETETLFDPVIKVPLVIFEPGQKKRRDYFTPTSNIDLLPTLLHVTGQSIPDWVEGEILPPYNSTNTDHERSIFSIQARHNGSFNPLNEASVMMVKGEYKLHAYFGYEQLPKGETRYELYNLKNDPEELENLYSSQSSIAQDLRNEIQKKIEEVNKPYV
jgi:arylsulfatase A-like enzyme